MDQLHRIHRFFTRCHYDRHIFEFYSRGGIVAFRMLVVMRASSDRLTMPRVPRANDRRYEGWQRLSLIGLFIVGLLLLAYYWGSRSDDDRPRLEGRLDLAPIVLHLAVSTSRQNPSVPPESIG
jgi:hypothetical protein